MSLINQMLQELDARGAQKEVAGAMDVAQPQVRAVPVRQRMPVARTLALVAAVGGGLLLALAGWYDLHSQRQPVARGVDKPAIVPAPKAATSAVTAAAIPVATPAIASAMAASSAPPASQSPASATPGSGAASAEAASEPQLALKLMPDLTLMPLNTDDARSDASVQAAVRAPAAAKPAAVKLAVNRPQRQPKALAPATPGVAAIGPALAESPVKINKQISELPPRQRAENEYRKAILLAQTGRGPEAIDGLEQALLSDARHVAARQSLIALLLENKRPDDAIRSLREGLALDPAQTGLAMILARLQVEKGNQKTALDTLNKSLPYALERADYQAFLAALLQRDKRHTEAADHYKVALRLMPGNAVWWMGLGISLQAENSDGAAQDAYRRAKELNTLAPALQTFVEEKLRQLK
jgi:MSHA biogenesis protein MshN